MLAKHLGAKHHRSVQSGIPYTSCFFLAMFLVVLPNNFEPAYGQVQKTVIVSKITVVDETNRGVPSEIRKVDDSDSDTHFAYTDEFGIVKPERECNIRDRLKAVPNVNIYTSINNNLQYCKKIVKIGLMLTSVAKIMFKEGKKYEKIKKYGIAAMIYNEVSWRTRRNNKKLSKYAAYKAYETLGKKLGVINPLSFDPRQNSYVFTPQTVEILRAFQSRQGLTVSGKFDAATQQAISKRPIWSFILASYKKAYREMGITP